MILCGSKFVMADSKINIYLFFFWLIFFFFLNDSNATRVMYDVLLNNAEAEQ